MPYRWKEFREEVLKLENGREVLFSGRVDNANVPWITDSMKRVIEVGTGTGSIPFTPSCQPFIAQVVTRMPCHGQHASVDSARVPIKRQPSYLA
jgi:hypothetical protein